MKRLFFLAIGLLILAGCGKDAATPSPAGDNGQGGSLARFCAVGDILYVVTDRELQVYKVNSDGDNTQIRILPLDNGLETLFRHDSILFVGAADGMYLFDIRNPEFPRQYAKFLHVVARDPVVSNGELAFVTLRSFSQNGRVNGVDRLDVIDIRQPYAPRLLVSKNMDSPAGLAIFKDLLFVCDRGVKIFGVDSTLSLPPMNFIPMDAHDLVVIDSIAMVIGTDGLSQYKLTPDVRLEFLSKIPTAIR